MGVGAISRFVLAHKAAVVSFWFVVTIAAVLTAGDAVKSLSSEFSIPGKEGSETSLEIVRIYGNGGLSAPTVPVISLPTGKTVDSPEIAAELTALDATIAAAAPSSRIASYASTGDRAFVSDDGETTFILVFTPLAEGFETSADVLSLKAALDGATIGGQPVMVSGYDELQSGGAEDGSSGVLIETLIGGLGALIVLAWVFGSFLALVPLLIAAVSILTTFFVIYGLTQFTEVSIIVEFVVALIGLGVAIDYALLIVTRWREEREGGMPNDQAVQRAMETAGSAVIFSGLTVGVGLFALVVLPVPFLRSIGYGGILIPAVSVTVAITLLPVILATIGPKLDWPRLRKGSQESKAWSKWAALVVRRRWIAAGAALLVLTILTIPALSLRVGDSLADALITNGQASDGLRSLNDAGIGSGVLLPFEMLVPDLDPDGIAAKLASVDGVRAVAAPPGDAWRRDQSAILLVLPRDDANSRAGASTLDRVRTEARAEADVRVGGPAALNADFVDAIYGNFLLLVSVVAFVTFLLLVWAFRSILLPLKALILNIFSVGAAYGVLVLVWQKGYGADILWGFEATGSITAFVPLVVFAFLFGLSMDYEVFILARMREEYDISGDTDTAIIRGIGMTGRLVTSAALILFLAFAALASAPVVVVKVLATGLAAGILLDATIVRGLLVPASVSLLGKWNWWLPTRLERIIPGAPHGSSDVPAVPLAD